MTQSPRERSGHGRTAPRTPRVEHTTPAAPSGAVGCISDPCERRVFHLVEPAPRPSPVDHLGLEHPDDALGERIDAPMRQESLNVSDGESNAYSGAVVDEHGVIDLVGDEAFAAP